jgi:hypothetical protein
MTVSRARCTGAFSFGAALSTGPGPPPRVAVRVVPAGIPLQSLTEHRAPLARRSRTLCVRAAAAFLTAGAIFLLLFLVTGSGSGWCAQHPGRHTIRLLFDRPHRINRIQLEFQEHEWQRTREFVLRWFPGGGASWRKIVRQQYNFSPPDASREREDYTIVRSLTR